MTEEKDTTTAEGGAEPTPNEPVESDSDTADQVEGSTKPEPVLDADPVPDPDPEPEPKPDPDPEQAPEQESAPEAEAAADPVAATEADPTEKSKKPKKPKPAKAPPKKTGPIAKVEAALDKTVDGIAAFGRAMTTWAIWPFLFSVFLGSAIYFFYNFDLPKGFDSNAHEHAKRVSMTLWVAATAGGIFGTYIVANIIARIATGKWKVERVSRRLNGALAFVMAGPSIVAFDIVENIEQTSPKFIFFLSLIAGVAVGRTAYEFRRHSDRPMSAWMQRVGEVGGKVSPYLGIIAALGLWALYAWFFSDLAITNHQAMNTRTTDLGYYDNIFWQSAHGNPLGCTFIKAGYHGSAHFDPILVILSPIYMLYPRAEFLLAFQSIWLGAGAVPVYLLASRYLGRGTSLLFAASYCLHPALHGANMYEFHSLTLAGPVILWVLYLLESRRFKLYWLAVIVALLVREDIPLLLCFVGAACLLRKDRKYWNLGIATIIVSLVYFVVVKAFFMTSAKIFMDGKDAYSFAYYYDDLIPNRKGMGGLLMSLVTNPLFVLQHALNEKKVMFLITMFLPVLFLPFAAKRRRFMLAYGLLFILLASRGAVFSTHFQYTSVILPIMYATVPPCIAELRSGAVAKAWGLHAGGLGRALIAACFVTTAMVTWKHGAIVDNTNFRGGFIRISRELNERQLARWEWLQETKKLIPPDASVGVTNVVGPHVSNRSEVYFYGREWTQYIFVDEREIKAKERTRHQSAKSEGRIEELARHETFALFKANPNPPKKKAAPQRRQPKKPTPKPTVRPRPGASGSASAGPAMPPPTPTPSAKKPTPSKTPAPIAPPTPE